MAKTETQTTDVAEQSELLQRIEELEAETARLRAQGIPGLGDIATSMDGKPLGRIRRDSQSVGHDAHVDEYGNEVPEKKVP